MVDIRRLMDEEKAAMVSENEQAAKARAETLRQRGERWVEAMGPIYASAMSTFTDAKKQLEAEGVVLQLVRTEAGGSQTAPSLDFYADGPKGTTRLYRLSHADGEAVVTSEYHSKMNTYDPSSPKEIVRCIAGDFSAEDAEKVLRVLIRELI